MADGFELDIKAILGRLPHRPPFLLVDRVVELKEGTRVVGFKNVTINEDFFRGHFPGDPIMPGVLIVEALSQVAGLLISVTLGAPQGLMPYLVGVDRVRFRRPVVPGDRLGLQADMLQRRGRFWRFHAIGSVDGERAAEAEILLAVLQREEEGE